MQSGQTPLRSAILAPLEDEHIKELVECGANPNGETPFGTPLMAAIAQGSTSTLKLLISCGADVNFCGQTGLLFTRVIQGSTTSSLCIFKTLSEASSPLSFFPALLYHLHYRSLSTDVGITPLMTAVKGRHLEVIKLLLEAGADPFLESEGVSAAQLAEVSRTCHAWLGGTAKLLERM